MKVLLGLGSVGVVAGGGYYLWTRNKKAQLAQAQLQQAMLAQAQQQAYTAANAVTPQQTPLSAPLQSSVITPQGTSAVGKTVGAVGNLVANAPLPQNVKARTAETVKAAQNAALLANALGMRS